MDSAALLDLLGNENRRRILRLLSRKPCYVTEISEYLGVSPKAVIDHLRKLEDAGLVESRTDESRRKYFHISRNLRLEVSVSPYSFGTKSSYAASRNLDVSTCRHLSLDLSYTEDAEAISELAAELQALEELSQELSMAQRWVQGRITDTYDSLTDAVGGDGRSRLYAQVLAAIAAGADSTAEITRRTDAPEPVVEDVIERLDEQGVLDRDGGGNWTIAETA